MDFKLVPPFNSIFGPDMLSLWLDNISYDGYIDKSPAEERLINSFSYKNTYSIYDKPFRAHWVISDSKLLLGYVNGIINEKTLYSYDIFPELSGEELLEFFQYYTGELTFYPKTFDTSIVKNITYKGPNIQLHLKSGILFDMEYQAK